MAPHENDFRQDTEFVKMIQSQAKQQVLLDLLTENVKTGFTDIKQHLTSMQDKMIHSQENCCNFNPRDSKKFMVEGSPKSILDGVSPDILKTAAIVVVMIVAYLFGIDVK